MKIAIFGGSFDPPHLGHLEVIQQTIISLNIDKLIVMPAFLNPFKSQSFAPADLRLKWLKTMTKNMCKVEVSTFEIDQNRPVPSVETVSHFFKEQKIYFIIGADNLKSLERWHRFEELDAMVEWVVASRDDLDVPKGYRQLHVDHDISSSELREKMNRNFLDPCVAQEIEHFYREHTEGNI